MFSLVLVGVYFLSAPTQVFELPERNSPSEKLNLPAKTEDLTCIDQESVLSGRVADANSRGISNTGIRHINTRISGRRGVARGRIASSSSSSFVVAATASLLEGLGTVWVNGLGNLLSPGLVARDELAGVAGGQVRVEGQSADDNAGRHDWFWFCSSWLGVCGWSGGRCSLFRLL